MKITAQEYFSHIKSIELAAANDVIKIQQVAMKEISACLNGQYQGANLVEKIERINFETKKVVEHRYMLRDIQIQEYMNSIPEELEA